MFETLVWLVPVAVTLAGIWRPRAGLLLLLAALPLFGSSPGGPYLAALEAAGLAAIVTAWRGGHAEASPLGPAAAAFVAVSLLSLVPTPYQPPSWKPSVLLALMAYLPGAQTWSALFSWRAAADLVVGYMLFLTVRRAFAGRSLRPLALALLVGLVATLLLGIAAQAGLVSLLAYRPMVFPDLPVDVRLRSLFFASTRLAEYIVIAAPFALMTLTEATGWARWLLLPAGGLSLAGLGLTLQRGGWIAAACQMTLLGAVGWRRRRDDAGTWRAVVATGAILILTLALLVVGGVKGENLLYRVRGAATGITTRLPLWVAAGDMVRERPFLGQGLGTFAPAYDHLQEAGKAGVIPFRASGHQLYLQLAGERGLLGLLALGLLGAAAVFCLRRPRAGQEGAALGLAASLLGVAVYGLVQNLFQLRINGWLIWIVLGCAAVGARPRDSPGVRRAAWALVIAGLVVLPFRLASERPSFAGDREFGLHEVERSETGGFRWTDGLAVQRLEWAGETLVLSLVDGHPGAARRRVEVVVGVDGETVARLTASGTWREHRIELGPPRKQWLVLTLRVTPTFRPFSDYRRYPDLAPSVDLRRLGVAIREPSWQ